MDDLIHRYLDGEIELEALPPRLRAEARRFEAAVAADRARGGGRIPPGLEGRVMAAVVEEPGRRPAPRPDPFWRRAMEWLLRPRNVRVSPLAALAGAAAVALLIVGLPPWGQEPGGEGAVNGDLYVEFVFDAPGARSVAVAGDFTTWSPGVELQDPDGDGVWSGRVRLEPGVHKYMFVVDGSRWITDPRAGRWVDDGFGNRNALLVVPGA